MDGHSRPFTGKIGDGDIRLLKVFRTVTQRGGFAAAESELQLGLPSISRYIKDLETRLGVRLCRRGRVGFSLTEQGSQVYEASLKFLANIERFEAEIRNIHSELIGALEIGVVDTLITDPHFPLPEILAAYKAKYPGVSINMRVKTSNIIEQGVLDGSLHIGLIFGRRRISQLSYRHLYQEISNLYCASTHAIAKTLVEVRPEDLIQYDYVGYSFTEDIERLNIKGMLRPTAGVDHMEAVATLIGTGQFIGFLPDHYVDSLWRCADFQKILPEVFAFTTDIELISRQGAASALVFAFMKLLDEAQAPALRQRPALQAVDA